MATYELIPHNGRKSFYGKALVQTDKDGNRILYSYDTCVLSIDKENNLHRHWDCSSPSVTTMTHIKSFLCEEINEDFGQEFNSRRYMALDYEPSDF